MRELFDSQPFFRCRGGSRARNLHFFEKKSLSMVDGLLSVSMLLTPPEAGSPWSRDAGDWFLYILGLQIGTQFCPGMMNGNVNYRRCQIEFFCRPEYADTAGSLKSTYRVVSKYNFKS